jgi:hypothetical protein
MTSEKRRYPRFPVDLRVVLEVGGEQIEARACDLSLGGMFVECARGLPFDTEVVAVMVMPTLTEPARIPANVRWTIAEGMGLAFGTIRTVEARAIHHLEDVVLGR